MNTTADYSRFRIVADPTPTPEPTPTTEEIEEILEDLVARGLATIRRQPDGKNRYYALPDVGN